ncbi:hypothetical protein BLJAPNOD_00847 [Ensifer sp. M14]|nr:hypothetical protein BLJAPNOD_00847 [Ensifer sp. M14]
MLYVPRVRGSAPHDLVGVYAQQYQAELDEYLQSGSVDRRPPKPPQELIRETATSPLMKLFRGKCAYCESYDGMNHLRIDHFRPAGGAERRDGAIDYRHYAWLGVTWENLYPVCEACARSKRNQFPVDKAGPVGADIRTLRRVEGNTLLDPCYDKPVRHIIFDENGLMTPRSLRGEMTIEIANLNRSSLGEKFSQRYNSA